MNRVDLEKAFGDLITAARRTDLTAKEREDLRWFVEMEARLLLHPIEDSADAWADLGFRRAAS